MCLSIIFLFFCSYFNASTTWMKTVYENYWAITQENPHLCAQNIRLPKHSTVQNSQKYTHIKGKSFMLAFTKLFWEFLSRPLNKMVFSGNILLNRSSFLESQTWLLTRRLHCLVTRLGLYWKMSNQGMLSMMALERPQYRVHYKFEVFPFPFPFQFISDLSSIWVPIATYSLWLQHK